jgi:predicted DCC family thiol-disulfide oxidoreductase YuxK
MVVLFDGVCNLCSGAVQFIIKRDRAAKFKFASLQSGYGQQQLERFQLRKVSQSIILIKDGKAYQQSEAALLVTKHLNGLWPVFYIFMVVPRFIRDGVYNWIARNRYTFFGRKETCWIPSPELKSRFID